MKKLFIPALLVMAYFSSCKSSSEIVSLKLQMPAGNTYDYTMVMDMNMNQEMMGQQMEMETKLTYGYVFEVLKDSADWKTIRSTIGRMRMDMKAMGMNMSLDTDNPSDSSGMLGSAYKLFAGMKGKQFSFTINDKGEVGQITGLKEIRDAMLAEMPNEPGMEKQMEGTLDEESFRQNLEQSFNIFPAKDVAVGESWTKTSNLKAQGMNIKSENTYTLESVKDGRAFIKVKQKLSSGKTEVKDAEMTMDGTGDGTYTYEQATGMVLGGDLKWKMNMEVSAQGKKVPVKMDMDISIKGKKR
jgi:hypothetical protein